jgi:hypothetical protein
VAQRLAHEQMGLKLLATECNVLIYHIYHTAAHVSLLSVKNGQ